MGIGHRQPKQISFLKTLSLSHGGDLRKKRKGRGARPLSPKDPLHVVFKIHRHRLRHKSLRSYSCFFLVTSLIEKYSRHFFVKVEQVSIQGNHIHLLLRTSKRSRFQNFFRVVTGQIAQRLEKKGLLKVTDTPGERQGLWMQRPFSRVVKGFRGYVIVRNYIRLNEKEALLEIPYQKKRLRGLSSADWQILWG